MRSIWLLWAIHNQTVDKEYVRDDGQFIVCRQPIIAFSLLYYPSVWHWTIDINIRVYHKTITYDLRTRCLPSVLDCVAGWLVISVVMVGVDNDITRILPQIDMEGLLLVVLLYYSCWYLSIYWERLLSTYINCRVQQGRVEGSWPSGTLKVDSADTQINGVMIRKWFLWNFGIGWNAGKGSAPFKVSLPSRLY